MTKDDTLNDLLRYVYNEISDAEAERVKQLLNENWQCKEAYDSMLAGKEILDMLELQSPSSASIGIIMDYSRKTEETGTLLM